MKLTEIQKQVDEIIIQANKHHDDESAHSGEDEL